MEKIRQAIERARASEHPSESSFFDNLGSPQRPMGSGAVAPNAAAYQIEETELNSIHLLSRRIVSHNGADQRSRPYDMLRTQVLRSMAVKGWKILGVTSPTSGCGKTLTAVNLAFSISRQRDQSVVLVDGDLQKPQIANCLGLTPTDGGVLDLLNNRTTLRRVTIPVRAGNQHIVVLPTTATRESSELMSSRAMHNLLQNLRESYQIIILDLPPILSSDDVISILPQVDCVLLVAAVGLSKASEVEECIKHLQLSELVRLVVNKSTDAHANYYYY